MRALLFAVAASCLLPLAACTSVWEESFEPAAPLVFPPTESVEIRRVPWERIDEFLVEFEAQLAEDDVHFNDWSPEKREAAQQRLLRALQFPEDAEDVAVLGRSAFTTVQSLRPDDPMLRQFATSIGADYAIWSTDYLGKTEVVRDEAVTVIDQGFGAGYGSAFGRRGGFYGTGSGVSTIYVPVVVEADAFAWLVYYLRVREP